MKVTASFALIGMSSAFGCEFARTRKSSSTKPWPTPETPVKFELHSPVHLEDRSVAR